MGAALLGGAYVTTELCVRTDLVSVGSPLDSAGARGGQSLSTCDREILSAPYELGPDGPPLFKRMDVFPLE